ncbi:hypothetical protein LA081_03640 [Mycoplasmopsis synoviae]|nr:hypothetical protein LA081_03640 [Mycoplasmopsis synoviae]
MQTVSDEVAAKRKANNDRFIEKLKNAVAAVDNQIALGKKQRYTTTLQVLHLTLTFQHH